MPTETAQPKPKPAPLRSPKPPAPLVGPVPATQIDRSPRPIGKWLNQEVRFRGVYTRMQRVEKGDDAYLLKQVRVKLWPDNPLDRGEELHLDHLWFYFEAGHQPCYRGMELGSEFDGKGVVVRYNRSRDRGSDYAIFCTPGISVTPLIEGLRQKYISPEEAKDMLEAAQIMIDRFPEKQVSFHYCEEPGEVLERLLGIRTYLQNILEHYGREKAINEAYRVAAATRDAKRGRLRPDPVKFRGRAIGKGKGFGG